MQMRLMINVEPHVGQDMSELKPVETRPLLLQTTGGASLADEAGTICHETGAGNPQHSVVGGCRTDTGEKTRQAYVDARLQQAERRIDRCLFH
jgi:hypothetical protein